MLTAKSPEHPYRTAEHIDQERKHDSTDPVWRRVGMIGLQSLFVGARFKRRDLPRAGT
jgi:hypothetical protein